MDDVAGIIYQVLARLIRARAICASRDSSLARFAPRAIRASRDSSLAQFALRAIRASRDSRLARFEPRAIRASRSRLALRAWRTNCNL